MNKLIFVILFLSVSSNTYCCSSHKESKKAHKSQNRVKISKQYEKKTIPINQTKLHKTPKPHQKFKAAPKPVNKKSTISIPSLNDAKKMYPWKRSYNGYISPVKQIPDPKNFKRIKLKRNSYQYWLRHIPLLPINSPVKDYTGRILPYSTAVAAAVIDLDLDKRGLQQCMDSIIRLRAEYLWQANKKNKIKFKFEGKLYLGWNDWQNGFRPVKKGRKYILVRKKAQNNSKSNFYKYLDYLNIMTGTVSNTDEPKVSVQHLKAGDFLVYTPPSGQYGHAVLIMDVAKSRNGKIKVLLGEGYTPAQSFHILKHPNGKIWYEVNSSKPIKTPLWHKDFHWNELRRFKY